MAAIQRFTRRDGTVYYRARLRLADGSRPWADIPDKHGRTADQARAYAARLQALEDEHGALLGAKRQAVATLAPKESETCDEWYERYYAYQRELGRSAAKDARSSWRAWISPLIGPKPMASVTRDDIEDIRDALDAAIEAWKLHGRGPGRISGKRSMNVWSALTVAFKAAMASKRRDLRVVSANPCVGVEPPGDRDSRKPRRKPFVFPVEFARLVACEAVPIEWRELHAVAAFTYLRPGELRVLRWTDVDLEHGMINVSRAWDSREGKVKTPKTRNGVRSVPIHASLAPLLERMRCSAASDEALVVPLLANTPEDDVAELTRTHLRRAGISRPALFTDTATTVQANFRTWRDSGITWLAMANVGVDRIMRRAGHDAIQTTLGYVKQAEDLIGDLGEPFAPLPAALLSRSKPRSKSETAATNALVFPSETLRRGRDSNPRSGFSPTPA